MIDPYVELFSPLYSFWISDQNEEDEEKRLEKVNKKKSFSILLIKEPYKWEILFQSSIKCIESGDYSAAKALGILLSTLVDEEKNNVLSKLEKANIISRNKFFSLQRSENISENKLNKTIKMIRVLFSIYLNPISINLKRKKNHSYELIGNLIYKLKKFIKF